MGTRVRWTALVVLIGFGAACSNSPTSPTAPNFVSATRFFSDVLVPSGTSTTFTFTTAVTNDIAVTLASLTDATGEPIQAEATLNLGTVSGTSCSPTTATKVVASTLTATVTASSLPAGTYCVSVADAGEIPVPADFTVRVVTSSGTPPIGNSATDALPSALAYRGTSMKTFNATGPGAASITLTSNAYDVPIELSLGVWDGSTCRLNTSIVTTSGTDPQITTNVDAGAYCVRLADIGNLPLPTSITGTIQHQ
jgi:hypothetical protein